MAYPLKVDFILFICHALNMAGVDVKKLVDELLSADKTLEGVPNWEQSSNIQEYRLTFPVFIDGRSTEAFVEINAYPNAPSLRFRILFIIEKCVWRIDHTEYERHINPIDTFNNIQPSSFLCPHYHSWEDNRRYCTKSSLPKRLMIGRPLPENIKQFDAAFRWFCGKINISQLPSGMVELPLRTTLL